MSSQLAELLLRRGRLTEAQLARARAEQKKSGQPISATIVSLGYLAEHELAECLRNEYGCGVADPAAAAIPAAAIDLVPRLLARRHELVPLSLDATCITLAMADPSDVAAINEVKFITGRDVRVAVATLSSIRTALRRCYGDEGVTETPRSTSRDITPDAPAEPADNGAENAPVVRLVNLVVARALQQRASDIHFEPFEQTYRIRYRVDGVLREAMRPPSKLRHPVTARLKVMAKLDIAERRLPQDGRFRINAGEDHRVDLRTSVVPTLFGEKVVLRVLDRQAVSLDLGTLGFDSAILKDLRDALGRPHGMLLVTGPTGSGKTTTLYAALSELNDLGRNICTVEDPVEYDLVGINQVQIHDEIGFTFAAALRALLRQDPDVIMLGEVRDRETAEIAIRAALTGHLVLSTLHTNDAASTATRLIDMGIEPFLVASALNLVLAQRLLRRLCTQCRQHDDRAKETLELAGVDAAVVAGARCFRPIGCEHCGGSGYRGRIAVYEAMGLNGQLRSLILERATAETLAACSIENGMKSLRHNALVHVAAGTTSLAEALENT
jgi:type IV pilus assembly protein PilB